MTIDLEEGGSGAQFPERLLARLCARVRACRTRVRTEHPRKAGSGNFAWKRGKDPGAWLFPSGNPRRANV